MIGAVRAFGALGTTATLVVDGDDDVATVATHAVEREVREIDEACSRFRSDSDLARVNANGGRRTAVSPRFLEAVDVALRAAAMTDGIVTPTVGRALRVIGYDRDFDEVETRGPTLRVRAERVPGWWGVHADHDAGTVCVPEGVELDLGATAKALCADRAASAVHTTTGAGVLVSLGGDVATAGPAPGAGWSVRVADDHRATAGGQTIAINAGGLATSGIARRRWVRGGDELHHEIDPRTGTAAETPWRTVTVAAASCVDANIASTAAIVLGTDAIAWLEERSLPARLVARRGAVTTVGGWPLPEDRAT
jgi:thiamine biosynthesis lipoprotein